MLFAAFGGRVGMCASQWKAGWLLCFCLFGCWVVAGGCCLLLFVCFAVEPCLLVGGCGCVFSRVFVLARDFLSCLDFKIGTQKQQYTSR
jgi:hypothetical protein